MFSARRTLIYLFATQPGEVCLTNDELKAAPPHRAEHKVAERLARSGDGTNDGVNNNAAQTAANSRLKKGQTRRGAGGSRAGGMGASGSPTILALAVQVSWPEDPESVEGKLVRNLQNEQALLSTRVEALKVGQIIAAVRYGLVRDGDVVSGTRSWRGGKNNACTY